MTLSIPAAKPSMTNTIRNQGPDVSKYRSSPQPTNPPKHTPTTSSTAILNACAIAAPRARLSGGGALLVFTASSRLPSSLERLRNASRSSGLSSPWCDPLPSSFRDMVRRVPALKKAGEGRLTDGAQGTEGPMGCQGNHPGTLACPSTANARTFSRRPGRSGRTVARR